MGATFPVGSILAPSHPYITSTRIENGEVVLRFWADNEKTYSVLSSPAVASGAWTQIANVPAPALPRLTEVRDPLVPGQMRFYRLVTPAQ